MKFTLARVLLHAEGLAVLVLACWLYGRSGYSWGWFAVTLLLPDVVLFGYLAGHRVGSLIYNVGHTYLSPLALGVLFHFSGWSTLQWIPLVWIAHIGMDRSIGYGLRYPTSFKDTHLARA